MIDFTSSDNPHQTTQKMWTFIPRLPNSNAWSQKIFPESFHSLETMLNTIKMKKNIKVKGQLMLKNITEQTAFNIPIDKYYMNDALSLMFNSCQELEILLNTVKHNNQLDSKLYKVYLYEYGYFTT